ncbi:MAG: hypothetical protein H7Y86_06210 [Rhizobacter sp.]|nr:hypothetical protein [Ferruginibacter sp.]
MLVRASTDKTGNNKKFTSHEVGLLFSKCNAYVAPYKTVNNYFDYLDLQKISHITRYEVSISSDTFNGREISIRLCI